MNYDATSAKDGRPDPWVSVISFAAVSAAGLYAYKYYVAHDPDVIKISAAGFSVFAPMYVVAQALERLLEPFTSFVKSSDVEKEELRMAREAKLAMQRSLDAKVANPADPTTAADALDELDESNSKELLALTNLRKKRAERVTIWWAVNTVLALLVTSWLGLGLIRAISTGEMTLSARAIDVVLTGIAIGAGTKPLHDLISRLEKAKTNSDASTKPTAQIPGTGAGKAR